ncbi:hypothetical protein MJA45_03735 [Paenibacillus aurantius]|uniref:Lipoprotein n=1 Tax=Paenibacillus aurantius TaxID=2918900 RepID=A0AA96LFB8_9BACL|nr:hypothetical protein [Paenibacillus aurantius]WNQ12173.1 hypothetical protein MJA45_03735 [Paenibacillus aurantius]
MKRLLPLALLLSLLAGCSLDARTSGKGSSGSYPGAVAWNGSLYGLSVTEVPAENIGRELGSVQKQVTPMPRHNGEANSMETGTLFFEIKGTDPGEAVAVEKEGRYYHARKMGPLP